MLLTRVKAIPIPNNSANTFKSTTALILSYASILDTPFIFWKLKLSFSPCPKFLLISCTCSFDELISFCNSWLDTGTEMAAPNVAPMLNDTNVTISNSKANWQVNKLFFHSYRS